MQEVSATSGNLYLVPSEPPDRGEMRPMVEVILITSQPKYTMDDVGTLVRSRITETVRFHTSPRGLRELARQFAELADMADGLSVRVAGATAVSEPKAARKGKPASKNKPEATIDKCIRGHTLIGEKWNGRWTLVCNTWPELAAQHAGCADASNCIDEFERRATAGGAAVAPGAPPAAA